MTTLGIYIDANIQWSYKILFDANKMTRDTGSYDFNDLNFRC